MNTFIGLSNPEAVALRDQLRSSSDSFIRRRRTVAALSLVAIGAMGLISWYQLGILKHLPEPPLPGLDADKVDAAPEAYERLSAPDATLGVGSYAATLLLAAMGAQDRSYRQPWLPLALAGKLAFDLGQAARILWVQWTRYRAFCFYCLLTAAATIASAPLAWGETRAALRRLKSR